MDLNDGIYLWCRLGISLFSSLGGLLCGYGMSVISHVLTIESFGAKFPEVYMNASLKGWCLSPHLCLASQAAIPQASAS